MVSGTTSDGELYRFDFKKFTWSIIPTLGVRPTERAYANLIVTGKFMYLSSGWKLSTSEVITDTLYFDLDEKQWHPLHTEGFSKFFNSFILVEVDGAYYSSGGWTPNGVINATYKYEIILQGRGIKRTLISPDGDYPEPRLNFAAAYNSGKMYIFGGMTNQGQL
jgi:hypothetical protein